MKRKTFIKLVCVILCILTIFCSGCYNSYIRTSEQRQDVVDTMQSKKTKSQKFIPQCTDYTLKISLPSWPDESIPQGYFTYDEFFKIKHHAMN